MKIKITIFLILFFLVSAPAFAGGWLIYHDGPYTGKVVDAEIGEPIEGAAVVGIWNLEIYGGAGGVLSRFFDANESVTDKNGQFIVPQVTGFHWWPLAKLGRAQFIIFKSGYDSYPSYELMKPGISGMEQKGFLNFTENLIKLNKLKSREERENVLLGIDDPIAKYFGEREFDVIKNKLKYFFKVIEEEKIYLRINKEGK